MIVRSFLFIYLFCQLINHLFIHNQLREFDRCRTLYTKYLEYNPANCAAWIKFAELEKLLGENERCRAIFELAIGQPVLDMPELLWKAYIDFEIEEKEYEKTRDLYQRLLERTEHVKVYISYAQFELSVPTSDEEGEDNNNENVVRARKVFEKAIDSMKQKGLKEEVKKREKKIQHHRHHYHKTYSKEKRKKMIK